MRFGQRLRRNRAQIPTQQIAQALVSIAQFERKRRDAAGGRSWQIGLERSCEP